MPPFPAAQFLRGRTELARRVGNVVALQRRGRGSDAGTVRLELRLAFLVGRPPGVALRLASLPGLADGKEDRADESQDQGCPGGDHPAHQPLVPPRKLAQVV